MELRLPNVNFVFVSGRLTKDPEFKVTGGGLNILTMRIAVSKPIKDKATGEWKDEAFFLNVDMFGESAARVKDRLKKGSPVLVEGRLKGREYEDKTTGQKRAVLDIIAQKVQLMEKTGAAGAPGKSDAGSGPVDGDLEEVPF